MNEFVCPSCGGYLCHDYNITNLMSCLCCRAVYQLNITLVSTDHTDNTTIANQTEQGEYQYG